MPDEYSAERMQEELERIEQGISVFDIMTLATLHVEPVRPREGMTVLADGTDWNPGAGQGVYTYYNGAWRKLG